mgnify:CR=1 FL=1
MEAGSKNKQKVSQPTQSDSFKPSQTVLVGAGEFKQYLPQDCLIPSNSQEVIDFPQTQRVVQVQNQ